jgi:hypothetical protein
MSCVVSARAGDCTCCGGSSGSRSSLSLVRVGGWLAALTRAHARTHTHTHTHTHAHTHAHAHTHTHTHTHTHAGVAVALVLHLGCRHGTDDLSEWGGASACDVAQSAGALKAVDAFYTDITPYVDRAHTRSHISPSAVPWPACIMPRGVPWCDVIVRHKLSVPRFALHRDATYQVAQNVLQNSSRCCPRTSPSQVCCCSPAVRSRGGTIHRRRSCGSRSIRCPCQRCCAERSHRGQACRCGVTRCAEHVRFSTFFHQLFCFSSRKKKQLHAH